MRRGATADSTINATWRSFCDLGPRFRARVGKSSALDMLRRAKRIYDRIFDRLKI
jgi:hypothetical protein